MRTTSAFIKTGLLAKLDRYPHFMASNMFHFCKKRKTLLRFLDLLYSAHLTNAHWSTCEMTGRPKRSMDILIKGLLTNINETIQASHCQIQAFLWTSFIVRSKLELDRREANKTIKVLESSSINVFGSFKSISAGASSTIQSGKELKEFTVEFPSVPARWQN